MSSIENFCCIIGAQRCGTTYLYHILDAHPQIEMAKPVKPEPKFFLNDSKFSLGKKYYTEKYFSQLQKEVSLIGEKGTSYLEYPFVSKRIKSFFPEGKLLVILRNPVHRALSNYYFSVRNGLETRSLQEVFIEKKPAPEIRNKISVSPFNYLQRGNYDSYLIPYMEEFGKNIKIVIFEECIGNADAVRNIYEFLGADQTFVPQNISVAFNSGEINYSSEVPSEIFDFLHQYYQNKIKKIEHLLNRPVSIWYDKI